MTHRRKETFVMKFEGDLCQYLYATDFESKTTDLNQTCPNSKVQVSSLTFMKHMYE